MKFPKRELNCSQMIIKKASIMMYSLPKACSRSQNDYMSQNGLRILLHIRQFKDS